MSIRVVSYSTRRGAFLPEVLARCINARTSDVCRRVWASESGESALRFEGDRVWTSKASSVETELREADVVIVHDGKVAPSHRNVLAEKPVVRLAEDWLNAGRTYGDEGPPGVVLGQHHAILPQFRDWRVVPLPIPLWEEGYQPIRRGRQLTLCYAPPRCVGAYPSNHRLHWHSKGYRATMQTLNRLVTESGVPLQIVRTGWGNHKQALELKRLSHIVIDECVTGSYHLESLEGLAVGAVVVNGLGLQPAIQEIFCRCAGGEASSPFCFADRRSLANVLRTLVEKGAEHLTGEGTARRQWMEEHWNFEKQWLSFWRPVLLDAIASRGRRRSAPPRVLATAGSAATQPKLSVVVISHNEGPYLRRTVSSFMRTLPPRSDLVLVDDHSTDGSADSVERDYKNIIVVRPAERLGVAASRNFGAVHCRGEVLVFSDAHVEVPDYWSQRLLKVLERKEVGAVAPAINNLKLRSGGGKCGGTWRWDNASLSWKWLDRLAPHPYAVPLLCGCFMAMRHEVFEEVAGFDAGMVQYALEDSELSYRLWSMGYECWVVPAVIVAHRFGVFGARSRNSYKFHSDVFLHNELRLAVVHFGEERIQRLVGRQVQSQVFAEAFCRLAASDAGRRREQICESRQRDDDWFFRRFGANSGRY